MNALSATVRHLTHLACPRRQWGDLHIDKRTFTAAWHLSDALCCCEILSQILSDLHFNLPGAFAGFSVAIIAHLMPDCAINATPSQKRHLFVAEFAMRRHRITRSQCAHPLIRFLADLVLCISFRFEGSFYIPLFSFSLSSRRSCGNS